MNKRIAFQGELGSNSHEACTEHFPDYEPVPYPAFEEAFDVKAAAPVAVAAAAGGPAAPAAEAAEEQDEFDVILEAAGDKKIQVIKEVRALTSLGLKEAKDLVDGAPKPVLEKVNKETADKAKAKLEAEGAKVTLK